MTLVCFRSDAFCASWWWFPTECVEEAGQDFTADLGFSTSVVECRQPAFIHYKASLSLFIQFIVYSEVHFACILSFSLLKHAINLITTCILQIWRNGSQIYLLIYFKQIASEYMGSWTVFIPLCFPPRGFFFSYYHVLSFRLILEILNSKFFWHIKLEN